MNTLDVIFLVPLLIGVFHGYKRGLIKELSALLSVVLGIWGSIHFSHLLEPKIEALIQVNASFKPILSFVVCFLAILIVVQLIGFVLDKVFSSLALGFFNKILGAFFGLLKNMAMIWVFLFVLELIENWVSFLPNGWKEESVLYPYFSESMEGLLPLFKKINQEITI